MMTLDRMMEATLLQNNGPTTNHAQISVSRRNVEDFEVLFGRAARYDYGWPVSDRRVRRPRPTS
jgi:hypothetical protein